MTWSAYGTATGNELHSYDPSHICHYQRTHLSVTLEQRHYRTISQCNDSVSKDDCRFDRVTAHEDYISSSYWRFASSHWRVPLIIIKQCMCTRLKTCRYEGFKISDTQSKVYNTQMNYWALILKLSGLGVQHWPQFTRPFLWILSKK